MVYYKNSQKRKTSAWKYDQKACASMYSRIHKPDTASYRLKLDNPIRIYDDLNALGAKTKVNPN